MNGEFTYLTWGNIFGFTFLYAVLFGVPSQQIFFGLFAVVCFFLDYLKENP